MTAAIQACTVAGLEAGTKHLSRADGAIRSTRTCGRESADSRRGEPELPERRQDPQPGAQRLDRDERQHQLAAFDRDVEERKVRVRTRHREQQEPQQRRTGLGIAPRAVAHQHAQRVRLALECWRSRGSASYDQLVIRRPFTRPLTLEHPADDRGRAGKERLEHRVQLEAEVLSFQRAFPEVGPANVKGIELNPYAAALARVSLWVGEIQWRRNGFAEARNPILKPLDTIECRDAILTADNTEPEWPPADVVIGNPPFLDGKLLMKHLGEAYVSRMFSTYAGGSRLGLLLVREGGPADRLGQDGPGRVRRDQLHPGRREPAGAAVGDRRAAVRVSLVCFSRVADESVFGACFDGQPVDEVYTDLTARRGGAGVDLTGVRRLVRRHRCRRRGCLRLVRRQVTIGMSASAGRFTSSSTRTFSRTGFMLDSRLLRAAK